MGYRIVYGKDPVVRRERRSLRLRVMTAACMLLFAALVRLAWPAGAAVLGQVLLPREQTAAAFSEMVAQVSGGEGLGAAVTAFCRTVVMDGLSG